MEYVELEQTKSKSQPPANPQVATGNQRTYLAPLFLRVACPSCSKSYRIDTRDIRSSEPHFECMACLCTFGFPFPVQNPMKVVARLLKPSRQPLDEQKAKAIDVKTCRKCSALNAKGSKECRGCGAIFAQLEGLPMDSKIGALPSLVRAWKDLMQDYDNLKKHVAFVDRCEDLQAIPYALKKYKDLKEAQPQDQIASEMVHRVLARRFARQAEALREHPSVQLMVRQVNWKRIRKLAPWLASGCLIAAGLTHPAFKNLAGVGASLLFISLGLLLFFKGRIRFEDFW